MGSNAKSVIFVLTDTERSVRMVSTVQHNLTEDAMKAIIWNQEFCGDTEATLNESAELAFAWAVKFMGTPWACYYVL